MSTATGYEIVARFDGRAGGTVGGIYRTRERAREVAYRPPVAGSPEIRPVECVLGEREDGCVWGWIGDEHQLLAVGLDSTIATMQRAYGAGYVPTPGDDEDVS